jgi:hypothetical protein
MRLRADVHIAVVDEPSLLTGIGIAAAGEGEHARCGRYPRWAWPRRPASAIKEEDDIDTIGSRVRQLMDLANRHDIDARP